MAEFIVTQLRRDPGQDFFRARVSSGAGVSFDVDRQHGSWQLTAPAGATRRDVAPHVARALQERARKIERAEQKNREAEA